MKRLIMVCCVFALCGCGGEDDQVLTPIKERQVFTDHVRRTINVQKTRARSREAEFEKAIKSNRCLSAN